MLGLLLLDTCSKFSPGDAGGAADGGEDSGSVCLSVPVVVAVGER